MLSFSWYNLAKNPGVRRKLREELAPLFGKADPGEFASVDLARCVYLDAVINETLRVDSPTGLNGGRATPPEGISIDGVYVPGNVVVRVSSYVYQRGMYIPPAPSARILLIVSEDERYFKHASEFIPERWTTRPELLLERRAFMPFLVGPLPSSPKIAASPQILTDAGLSRALALRGQEAGYSVHPTHPRIHRLALRL